MRGRMSASASRPQSPIHRLIPWRRDSTTRQAEKKLGRAEQGWKIDEGRRPHVHYDANGIVLSP